MSQGPVTAEHPSLKGERVLVLGNHTEGFPSGSVVKHPPANAGDMDLILGSGRSPGEGNGNPL